MPREVDSQRVQALFMTFSPLDDVSHPDTLPKPRCKDVQSSCSVIHTLATLSSRTTRPSVSSDRKLQPRFCSPGTLPARPGAKPQPHVTELG